jgi:uncharacterized membrane protein
MAIMALDRTRTFLTNILYNPSDLTRTFPALFFTLWISHLCTPLFLLLRAAMRISWQPNDPHGMPRGSC